MIFWKHLTEKTEIRKQTKELEVHEITERCILYDKMAFCWRKKQDPRLAVGQKLFVQLKDSLCSIISKVGFDLGRY